MKYFFPMFIVEVKISKVTAFLKTCKGFVHFRYYLFCILDIICSNNLQKMLGSVTDCTCFI